MAMLPLDPLPYGRHLVGEDDLAAVEAQLRSGTLTQGAATGEFEALLCEATGAGYAVAVSSGTAALHLACLAAELQAGDRAIAPDVTFVATANAIRYCGATPQLCDVDPTSGCATIETMQRAHELGAAKVMLPVGLSGHVPDLPGISALARRVHALVIEDAAHSLGATYEHDGHTFRSGGCVHSSMAILSFHPVKHVTTGEGGAITTNDPALADRLRELRTHGITKDRSKMARYDGPWYYEQRSLGFNYRMSDLHAALGISQMKKLPRFVARRREIAALYRRLLSDSGLDDRVAPLALPIRGESSHHLFVVRLLSRANESLEAVAARRLALYTHLHARGVHAQVHYIPVHRQPSFEQAGLSEGSFAGALDLYARCLSLPMFPAMTDSDVARVVAELVTGLA